MQGLNMTENTIVDFIQNEITNNDVVLFMKGSSNAPMCGFSAKVVGILRALAVDFKDHDVLASPELRQGIKDFSDWPTVPQLYIKGEFIGGCDIATELYENGELKKLIAEIKK
jgi:monothiol glutaredoxin